MSPGEARTIEALRAAVAAGARPRFVMFWRPIAPPPSGGGRIGPGCMSQWWPSVFTVGGARYGTAEHYMMAEKARIFSDLAARQRILSSDPPAAARRFGRQVRGFVEATWRAERFEVVTRGNVAKFGQDPALRAYLLGTGDDVLVEAAPKDKNWGIGLRAEEPSAVDVWRWRGLNLLGFALMEARARLRSAGSAG